MIPLTRTINNTLPTKALFFEERIPSLLLIHTLVFLFYTQAITKSKATNPVINPASVNR